MQLKLTDFVKNSIVLSSGVGLAQVLPLLFYPLLGRIFTVDEFGLLATLTAITSILVVVATGKYESGILIANGKREAASLAVLSLLLAGAFLAVAYVIMQFFMDDLLCRWLNESELYKWLFICPLSAFSIVVFNVYNEWCVREKYFKGLSANKIVNSGAIVLGKVVCGLTKVLPQGLVVGDTVGRVVTAAVCWWRAMKLDGSWFQQVTWSDIKAGARRYIEFPKYNMPGQLLNAVGMQAPLLLIAAFFNKTEVGYFSMAMAVFAIPITVISGALRDVFRQRANDDFKATGSCRAVYKKLFLPLSVAALAALLLLVWFLPWFTTLFLGKQWLAAGVYSQYLAPAMALSFVANSMSGVFIVAEKLKALFYWQVYYVVSTLAAVIVGGYYFKSMTVTVILFSIMRGSAYLLSIIMTYIISKGKQNK